MLHASYKGRDADAAADPDLPGLAVVEVETAIRPFDLHALSDAQLLAQPVGVVSQFLGDKSDLAILVAPARGDGVGVRALGTVRCSEGELPRLMARPPLLHLDLGLKSSYARIILKRGDRALHIPSDV